MAPILERVSKTSGGYKKAVVIYVSFALAILIMTVWWLPQKWRVCAELYDNLTAQIMCLA